MSYLVLLNSTVGLAEEIGSSCSFFTVCSFFGVSYYKLPLDLLGV